jgi:hypothetical protein
MAPKTGRLDYAIAPRVKTENMSEFLKQVSPAHEDEFVVMVADGASSHKTKKSCDSR